MFSHVRHGIQDEGVFDVPSGCGIVSGVSLHKVRSNVTDVLFFQLKTYTYYFL